MPELLAVSSSDELLIMIAHAVRDAKDLASLALTCRRLKHAAYEALYQNITLRELKGRGEAQHKEPFQGSYLLRTLLDRPDLARRTRKLSIAITGMDGYVGHDASCLFEIGIIDSCTCG